MKQQTPCLVTSRETSSRTGVCHGVIDLEDQALGAAKLPHCGGSRILRLAAAFGIFPMLGVMGSSKYPTVPIHAAAERSKNPTNPSNRTTSLHDFQAMEKNSVNSSCTGHL